MLTGLQVHAMQAFSGGLTGVTHRGGVVTVNGGFDERGLWTR